MMLIGSEMLISYMLQIVNFIDKEFRFIEITSIGEV